MGKVNIIRPQEGFQEQFCNTNVDFCIGGGILGGGKMLEINELVLTPTGWIRNGDLQVGMMVSTPYGEPARILQIFDHQDKEIFELETTDGRKSKCGLEHLWAFRTSKQVHNYRKDGDKNGHITINTTQNIIKRLAAGQKIYLPLANAQQFQKKELPIPPYALGVMIGDGCLTDKQWVGNRNAIPISNTEQDVINRFCETVNGSRVVESIGSFTKEIYTENAQAYHNYCREVGLNTYSYNKFIPKIYLNGSIEQRRLLLAGLFDTDGCVEDKNRYSYSTTSRQLADDVVYLCRSLGYKATKNKDSRAEKYTAKEAFEVNILTNDVIFSSEKHIGRYNRNIEKYQYKYKRTEDMVRVKSIKRVGVSDARCIFIDDPLHLYITNDFLVTHNSFAGVMAPAEFFAYDPEFRALFLRNNLDDAKASGGLLDTFEEVYGKFVHVVKSEAPRADFPCGARADITHVADQSRKKVLQRFKGRQYDYIYFDELDGFTWECFSAIYTRNRGKSRWTGKVRATTNPNRDCWVRKFIDWYIGIDGFIREDRNGVVRYFYMAGETVEDVVWGNSKEEVYRKCSLQIDRMLAKAVGKDWKQKQPDAWMSAIKSFTFYLGRMSENKAMLQGNDGYVGSVAVMGGRNSQQLLEGNWNVSPEEALDAPIPSIDANYVFLNDAQRNGDKWVTCDLADTGTDNFLCLAWDGFHIIDALILAQTTPRMNAERLQMFARLHNIPDNRIIYDAVRGTYINDYIPDAVQYVSYRAPMGLFGRMAVKLKDECYLRLVEVLKRHMMSMEDEVATRVYEHLKMKDNITIQQEFLEECAVVRFKEMANGKKCLFSKKEMNQKLGKGRSMDLLDPCAMRMMPVLRYTYGEELTATASLVREAEEQEEAGDTVDIYDDSTWF